MINKCKFMFLYIRELVYIFEQYVQIVWVKVVFCYCWCKGNLGLIKALLHCNYLFMFLSPWPPLDYPLLKNFFVFANCGCLTNVCRGNERMIFQTSSQSRVLSLYNWAQWLFPVLWRQMTKMQVILTHVLDLTTFQVLNFKIKLN